MIQRIQSLFLFFAAVTGIFAFFVPYWTYAGIDFTYTFTTLGVKLTDGSLQSVSISTIPVMVLLALHVALDFTSIFYFKNRTIQLKINSFNMFLTLMIIGTVFLWVPYMIKESVVAEENWGFGLLFPVISFVFLLLANKFIRKDEKLVKAADRLR